MWHLWDGWKMKRKDWRWRWKQERRVQLGKSKSLRQMARGAGRMLPPIMKAPQSTKLQLWMAPSLPPAATKRQQLANKHPLMNEKAWFRGTRSSMPSFWCMKEAHICLSALPNGHGVLLCDPWIGWIQWLITSDSWEMEGVDFFRFLRWLVELREGRKGNKVDRVMQKNGKTTRGKKWNDEERKNREAGKGPKNGKKGKDMRKGNREEYTEKTGCLFYVNMPFV